MNGCALPMARRICVLAKNQEGGIAMNYVLNSREMKQCDENTMMHYGMLSPVLMERAAYSVMEEIMCAFPERTSRVLIACGSGNNGGDGLALARLLYLKGYSIEILFAGNRETTSEEAKRQLAIAENYRIPFLEELPDKEYDIIVDSLFGIGLSRAVEGHYAELIRQLNSRNGYKVAVDICSGLSADSGQVLGVAFRADLTVTFGFSKIGHLMYPGAEYSGKVIVKDIGIDEKSLLDIRPLVGQVTVGDLVDLPKRTPRSNKGSYGKILIFAGSRNMSGAAVFSARAACASGAGLVRVATVEENRQILQTLVPEAILSTYDENTDMDEYVRELVNWPDAIVAGPGIGTSAQSESMIQAVLKYVSVPCVLDADGLNVAANHREWIREAKQPLILTPHPGEMSRLTGKSIAEIQENLIPVAQNFAREYNSIVVLKDSHTVSCTPEGFAVINTSGNDGMATAGSGDVLTGVIGAFLGQKLKPEKAAYLGVFVHGLAGDVMAEQIGHAGLMASDLVTGIKEILKEGNKNGIIQQSSC